ncbi:MAG: sigma 54-interacting transcriptional regulator [bacterium]
MKGNEIRRLDVRARVRLPIEVFYNNNNRTIEKDAMLSELSLSGVFLKPLPHMSQSDLLSLKIRLPMNNDEIIVAGEKVRQSDKGVAVRFLFLDKNIQGKLWQYIKKYTLMNSDKCPYCNHIHAPGEVYCRNCNGLLSFQDNQYLDKHIRQTLNKRCISRVKMLNCEQAQRVMDFIDNDLLKGRNIIGREELIGISESIQKVHSLVSKVAPTDMSVLILGESGTGKELTAKMIHQQSTRWNKPFIAFNCAAIPEGLLEAELFGYEKGSFTGAYTSRKGKIEIANEGTIFLDEIGDMPMNLQSKILRLLQERSIERLGSSKNKNINVRFIAATNIDINTAIQEGRFRRDLYFRLDEFTIVLPPVRERNNDSLMLATYFLNKFSKKMGKKILFTKEAKEVIKSYHWPGNVREIMNKIKRSIAITDNEFITPQELNLSQYVNEPTLPFIKSIAKERHAVEKQKLIEALNSCDNNISRTAKILQVSRPTIYKLMRKYFI